MTNDGPLGDLYGRVGLEYTRGALDHAIPLLYFSSLAAQTDPPPEPLRLLLEEFAAKAGLQKSDLASDEALAAKVGAYYGSHPVDAAVKRALQQVMAKMESAAAGRARVAEGLLDAKASLRPVGAGQRPGGSVGGGPLAALRARQILAGPDSKNDEGADR